MTDPALHVGGLTTTEGATILGLGPIRLMPVVIEQRSRIDAILGRTFLG